MTDIALGQSITGSLTADDPKILGRFYDEYNLNVDSFRQLVINIDPSTATAVVPLLVALVNSDTGAIVAEANNSSSSGASRLTLTETTFPGVNYKVRVSNVNLGDYTISTVDGGKATSIVSNTSSLIFNQNQSSLAFFQVGTVGASGAYFPLASARIAPLADVALAPSGQLYGLAGSVLTDNQLVRIDPTPFPLKK